VPQFSERTSGNAPKRWEGRGSYYRERKVFQRTSVQAQTATGRGLEEIRAHEGTMQLQRLS